MSQKRSSLRSSLSDQIASLRKSPSFMPPFILINYIFIFYQEHYAVTQVVT